MHSTVVMMVVLVHVCTKASRDLDQRCLYFLHGWMDVLPIKKKKKKKKGWMYNKLD